MTEQSPRPLPVRIHAAAHPSCCAGIVAAVECALFDAIVRAVEETSAHVCSYCSEALPVSLDENENLATARAHMATCTKHPMHELLEALREIAALDATDPTIPQAGGYAYTLGMAKGIAKGAIAKVDPPPGEFHASADVEIPEAGS